MEKSRKKEELLTLRNVLAMTAADIDIFLLQNEEQTGDNEKESFTREEVRGQLRSSLIKVAGMLESFGFDLDEPLAPHNVT